MSIVMTGGGTGGHLAIIKAVKEYLGNEELIYIGSTKGQDRQWFEDDKDFAKTYFLETKGVVNQGKLDKLKSLLKILTYALQVKKILQEHKASVVFSVGGFSAAPAAIASRLAGIPLVIHEQNAAFGSLNKLLKPVSSVFISSYLKESLIKAYPVKDIFFQNAHLRKKLKTIMFLGGSQGAKAINQIALSIAPELQKRGIRIIHQAGTNNVEKVQASYDKLDIKAEVFGFTTRLCEYMNEADFAVARAGASTLWELSASAVPTLYIPYPHAASDHQYHNAQFLVEKNLAWIMRESQIDNDKVLELLNEDLTKASKGLMDVVEEGGSQKIAKLLINI